jgi:hypothetical protein
MLVVAGTPIDPCTAVAFLECEPKLEASMPTNTLHLYTFFSTSNFVSNNTLLSSLLFNRHPISGTGSTVTAEAAPTPTPAINDVELEFELLSPNIPPPPDDDDNKAAATPPESSNFRSLSRTSPSAGSLVNGNEATLT